MKKTIADAVVLYPLDNDMAKTWFVQYPNAMGGRPLKKYGKLNKIASLDERLLEADKIINEIKKTLKPIELKPDLLITHLNQIVEARCIGKKQKTIWGYHSKLRRFFEWYRSQKTRELNMQSGSKFLQWVSQQPTVGSNTTINHYRRDLKSFFNELIEHGYISFNPFSVTRKLRETVSTNTWFRPDMQKQLKEMIINQDPQLWIVCMVQFYCFIRPGGEMRSLRIENILKDGEYWRFQVEGINAKTGHYRFIKIPDPLKELLEPYIHGYPSHYYLFGKNRQPNREQVGTNTFYNRHKYFLQLLKLPVGYTFYSWKNTGAVMMLKFGMSFKQVSMLMGHTSIETTDEYFKSLGMNDINEDVKDKYPII
jgi:integrase